VRKHNQLHCHISTSMLTMLTGNKGWNTDKHSVIHQKLTKRNSGGEDT